jgi:hypothetical protein
MSAELEEIVVTTYAADAQQLLPDPRQDFLHLALRRLVFTTRVSVQLRGRQRAPV